MDWNSVIEGVTAGVAGAAVLGVISGSRKWVQSTVYREKLKKSLRKCGVGSGIDGMTVSFSNRTGRPFRIRGVQMVTNGGARYTTRFTGKIETCTELSRKDIKKIKAGKISELSETVFGTRENVQPDEDGCVTLPPHSKATYQVEARLLFEFGHSPVSAKATFEFEDYSGNVQLFMVVSDSRSNEMIVGVYKSLRAQLESGSLNNARKMFGLPPVKLPVNDSKKNEAEEVRCGEAKAPLVS
jgi:hypothetical protein